MLMSYHSVFMSDQLSPNYRLPTSTIPSHYDLEIEPDHVRGIFRGNVKINITIKEEISEIKLHSYLLDIKEPSIVDSQGEIIPVSGHHQDIEQFYVLKSEKRLKIGDYLINLTFNGSLDGKLIGFHRTSYMNSITKKRR
jgi:hypothetical protein